MHEWNIRIKKAAMSCNFGKQLTEVLKDKFVTDLAKGSMFDRIYEEELAKTLAGIVENDLKR